MGRISTDLHNQSMLIAYFSFLIRENPPNPRHPRAILLFQLSRLNH
jgi:hypothetical protein